jgi:hypothetical protein
MKKKLFMAGMFGIVLAFGIAVVGCDNGSPNISGGQNSFMYTIKNKRSHTVYLGLGGRDFQISANSTIFPKFDSEQYTVDYCVGSTSLYYEANWSARYIEIP